MNVPVYQIIVVSRGPRRILCASLLLHVEHGLPVRAALVMGATRDERGHLCPRNVLLCGRAH